MTDYVGGISAMITVQYLAILGFTYWRDSKLPEDDPKLSYALSSRSRTNKHDALLLFTRTVSLLWFFSVTFGYRLYYYDVIKDGRGGEYFKWFTHWNIMLIVCYFATATFLSACRIADVCVEEKQWEQGVLSCYEKVLVDRLYAVPTHTKQAVARASRILNDVTFANAFFVTFMIYGLTDREMDFWNIAAHLTNLILTAYDNVSSAHISKTSSLRWNVTFMYSYVCAVWILRATGAIKYPYDFIDTTAGSYMYYFYEGMLLMHVFLFAVVVCFFGGVKGRNYLAPALQALLNGSDGDSSSSTVYDCIVVGLGAHGSSTAAHLAGRGLRVLAIEQGGDYRPASATTGTGATSPNFSPTQMEGNKLSASHGHSRVIRTAYFEDKRYVPLLQRALTLWQDLDNEYTAGAGTGKNSKLLHMTGGLMIGKEHSEVVKGTLGAAEAHGLKVTRLSAAEVAARFPTQSSDSSSSEGLFQMSEGDVALYEDEAGYLVPEACNAAHQTRAEKHGAKLVFSATVSSMKFSSSSSSTAAAAAASDDDDAAAALTGMTTASSVGDIEMGTSNSSSSPAIIPVAGGGDEQQQGVDASGQQGQEGGGGNNNPQLQQQQQQEEVVEVTAVDISGVTVTYKARKVVLAMGAYLPEFASKVLGKDPLQSRSSSATTAKVQDKEKEQELAAKQVSFIEEMKVVRRSLFWVQPQTPYNASAFSGLPIFLWELNTPKNASIYGFPLQEGVDGVKVAFHNLGPSAEMVPSFDHESEQEQRVIRQAFTHTEPRDIERNVSTNESDRMLAACHGLIPALSGAKYLNSTVCQYVNTPNEHFLVDYLAGCAQKVVVASPCSGHGFKFASVMGEIIADLVTEQAQKSDIELFSFASHLSQEQTS